MSFNLTLEQLNDPSIFDALNFLCEQPMGAKAAWNISRLQKKIDKAIKEARENYIKGLKSFVKLDNKGEIQPDVFKNDQQAKPYGRKKGDPVPGSYVILDEKKDEFEGWVKEYMQIEFTIESYKIHMDDLAEVTLTPAQLSALDPIILSREEALDQIKKGNEDNVQPIRPQ